MVYAGVWQVFQNWIESNGLLRVSKVALVFNSFRFGFLGLGTLGFEFWELWVLGILILREEFLLVSVFYIVYDRLTP